MAACANEPWRSPSWTNVWQHDALYDGLLAPLLIALLLLLLAGWEWWSYFNPRTPNPWLFSLVAISAATWAIWRGRTTTSKVKQLKLGRDGERAVGQFLERFRSDSFICVDGCLLANGKALERNAVIQAKAQAKV